MAIFDIAPHLSNIEQDFGLSDEALAVVIGVHPRTVTRWHRDGTVPGSKIRGRLEAMWDLRTRMLNMFSNREAAQEWLSTPSQYLGWLTPIEVLRAGRIDRVQADLDGLAAGIFQ